jgi:hypothetical protein
VVTGGCMLLALLPLHAQSKKDPLTEQQIEAVREAGDQPLERIKLFVGYVDDRAKDIRSLNKDSIAPNKPLRLHNLYDEFTRLSDELQDNMDNFDEQLKEIVDKTCEWTTVLNEPPSNPQYDFLRKTSLDANQSAHEGAVKMLDDETKYFAEKKKEEKEQQKEEQKR